MIMLIKQSNNKLYLVVSAIVFAVVGAGHLAIIVLQQPATIGGYVIPYEINGLVVILLGYLSTRGLMAARKL